MYLLTIHFITCVDAISIIEIRKEAETYFRHLCGVRKVKVGKT